MSTRAVLALDLGTTTVRALAVDGGGRVLGRAWRPLVSRFPAPGRLEQDPSEWWARSVEVLRAVLAETRLEAREIGGLGVVTQRATAVAWDRESGLPLAPAIGWQDQRTALRVQELASQKVAASTMTSATKLEWLLAAEPALRAAARAGRLRLGTPDVWLGDRLSGGGTFATDPSQASCTGLYDLARGTWHAEALALFGIEAEWLPALVPTSAVVAETPPSLLGAAIPLAARAGDQQAASFAQGVQRAGEGKLTVGTSAMLDVATGDTPARPRRGAYPLALWEIEPGRRSFCLEGTVVTAGAAIEWLVDLGLLASSAALDVVARSAESAEGAVFVPALQGLGTPHLDAAARGALLGLTRGTTAAHVVRAVVDGIAERCADVCEALALADGPLRVDGGVARSDVFAQALADACGREVRRASETETTGLGAALLAGVATGFWRDADAALATLPPPIPIEPRVGTSVREGRRAAWRRAIDRVRERAR